MFPHHWVCNGLNFADSVSCKRLEFSTRSSDPPNYIHTIITRNVLTSFLVNLIPNAALNSYNLGMFVACSGATFDYDMTKFIEILRSL